MAEVLGAINLLDKALPTGVDGTRIAEWAMRDGITYGQLANELALALGNENARLANDWGWIFYLTDELFMEYENGGAVTAMTELTDQDRAEPLKGTTIGHMLDLKAYGEAIGGTRRYMRDVRSTKIRAAISNIIRRGRWRFEQKLLTRLFTNTETLIGSAGYDVPFVRGTGGNVDFAPPAWDGEAFTTSHTHYLGVDSDSLTAADSLNQMAETLQEHGHNPPFTAIVARADIATYYGLQDWVEIVEPVVNVIDRGGNSVGPQFFAQGNRAFQQIGFYHSLYGLIEVRATARVPTTYSAMVKSYGQMAASNPLAVRVHPDVGFGFYVLPETTPDDDTPIKQLDCEIEFGIGVGMDRTNGAAALLVSGGAWANPTIT